MKRFMAVVSYDGSDFYGYQIQKDLRTVQGTLENALKQIFKQETTVVAAGRTDTGVHAYGQVVTFNCPIDIDSESMKNALNANLPSDVYVRKVLPVASNFHPRFQAKRRIYHYYIHNSPQTNIFIRKYAWWFPYEIDISRMRQAALFLEGEHDFTSFKKREAQDNRSNVRTIYRIRIIRLRSSIILTRIEGISFLRRMVRNIVGTLIKVGVGEWEPKRVKEILLKKDRSEAAATAPPHGLYLYSVEF